jgi:TRAP-type transport system periplasmic protein
VKLTRKHFFNVVAASVAAMAAFAPAAHAADIKERTIKLAVVTAPDHMINVGAARFGELIEKKSGGKMKVKVFANGTLGGEVQAISALQGGTLEATIPIPGALTGAVKEYSILDLPFVFDSEQQAAAVLDGPVGKRLMSYLPAKGLIGVGFMETGFRNYTNSKHAIERLEDFSGLKLRALQNPVFVDFNNALGANPVPLAFPEMYTAMESKTIDGQENTLFTAQSSKFYEVQKFVSVTRHIYAAGIVLFSKRFWDQLSADERNIIESSMNEVLEPQRKMARELDQKALDFLKKAGLKVSIVSPAERARMRERVKPVVDKYAAQLPEDLRKEFFAEVEKARKLAQ